MYRCRCEMIRTDSAHPTNCWPRNFLLLLFDLKCVINVVKIIFNVDFDVLYLISHWRFVYIFLQIFCSKIHQSSHFGFIEICRYRGSKYNGEFEIPKSCYLRAKTVSMAQWLVGSSLHLSIIGRNEFNFVAGTYT